MSWRKRQAVAGPRVKQQTGACEEQKNERKEAGFSGQQSRKKERKRRKKKTAEKWEKKRERFSGQQKEECENRLIEPIKERKERQREGWIFWGKRGRKGGSVFIIQGRKRP